MPDGRNCESLKSLNVMSVQSGMYKSFRLSGSHFRALKELKFSTLAKWKGH